MTTEKIPFPPFELEVSTEYLDTALPPVDAGGPQLKTQRPFDALVNVGIVGTPGTAATVVVVDGGTVVVVVGRGFVVVVVAGFVVVVVVLLVVVVLELVVVVGGGPVPMLMVKPVVSNLTGRPPVASISTPYSN